ncbi:polyprenol phosphomannose-dependent alpha 1,6 mannosyltransferase MptB [Sphaerisporangium dianthi]|uniref:Polyprenol phosphomannose-dependent alpha 1,6 mannosyltransferase MptB n=1 Tax=Sphaerisporangium dianthi TaxID=1436120 RepID=A0ABV9CEC8_9ACTN
MNRGGPAGHERWAVVAVGGAALSVLVTIAIGVLGPSAVVPPLPGPAWQPPYFLDIRPDGHLVIAMEAAAIALGAAGLAGGLLAMRRGWAPDPRWTLLAGCLAAAVLAFLPPSGSADHLNYAAYGRMAVLGHDPYVLGANALPGDPVAEAVELPWEEEPSVYGPVATAVQALAALAGGGSVRLTVFVLAAVNAAAFVATAWLLHRQARGDRPRQARAALLWAANPLVIYQLVAGMHVDTLAIALVVAALAAGASGRRWAAGPLLGLGIAVKANAGLVALGPAWALRLRPRSLAVVAGTATATVLAAYALAGPHALDPVLHASKSISWATPWHLVQSGLQALLGPGAYRVWIQLGSMALLVLLAVALARALREPYGLTGGVPARATGTPAEGGWWPALRAAFRPDAGDPPDAEHRSGAGGPPGAGRRFGGGNRPGAGRGPEAGNRPGGGFGPAAGAAAVAVAAWLFATPYALPWYDGLAFALLAALPASALDGFMVARLGVLSAAYLPARQEFQPDDLHHLLVMVLRSQVVPWILLALTAALAWWALTSGARGSTRRGSAAPPP